MGTLSGYLVKNWYSSNRLWTMQEKTCCSLSLPLSRKLASMSTTAGIASWPPYIFCKQDGQHDAKRGGVSYPWHEKH